jgi:hypothetical protein
MRKTMRIEVDEAQHKEVGLLVKCEIQRLRMDSQMTINPEKTKTRIAFLETIGVAVEGAKNG